MPFFAPGLRIAVFPDWETLPYDTFSPHQDLISERLATLWRMLSVKRCRRGAAAGHHRADAPGAAELPGRDYTFHFKQKDKLDEAALKSQLTLAGYQHVSQVVSPGEYAVRGGLIDLFPMGSPVPYRVDLFDDEIDSIRTFDPDSQRSLYPVPEVRLLPGREFPMDEAARTTFRARWREKLEGDPTKSRIYKDIGAGIATAGIEYYLPLFFEQTATLFDYLGAQAALVLHGEIDEALERFWTDTRERHRFLQHDPERPILAPEELFLRVDEFFALTQPHATLALRGQAPEAWARPAARRGRRPRRHRAAGKAGAAPRHHDRTACCCVAESEGRRESLLELLRDHRIDVPSVATLAEFEAGDEQGCDRRRAAGRRLPLASRRRTGRRSSSSPRPSCSPPRRPRAGARKQEQVSDVNALIKDLSELKVGDPVVHINHGIGRYVGLIAHRPGRRPSRVPAPRVRRQGHAVRAGGATAPDRPLHRRSAPTRRRCTGSAPASGKRPSARPPSRCATPPPNC